MAETGKPEARTLTALQWVNFFVADIQTGVGPFLAAYLATRGWNARDVGLALTFGGLVTVVAQTPAGAMVDAVHRKRALLAGAIALCAVGALLIAHDGSWVWVGMAQFSIGLAGAFLLPTLAAITLGLVGARGFDRQFGRNQSYNAAGNVFTALLLAGASYALGIRSIFLVAAVLAVPAWVALMRVRGDEIDYNQARGGESESEKKPARSRLEVMRSDRVLLLFLASAFLFHLANAAMLPQLGELLSHGNARTAAPFMAACIVVTQLVISGSATWIGRLACSHGRRPLLLAGFAALPLRALLYTLTHRPGALIAIQLLDGVANTVFGVVSILVIADRLRGTGYFNVGQGALGTMVGLGAALSATLGGSVIHAAGYSASFLALGGVAVVAFCVLWFGVPETRHEARVEAVSSA